MIYNSKKDSGFSLVEVLVAITILLLVLAGPMRVLTSTTNSTAFSSEQIIATFLAQEGLELVELGRDNYLLDHFQGRFARTDGTSDVPDPWARFVNAFANCIDDPNSASDDYVCGLAPQGSFPGYVITDCDTAITHDRCRIYEDTNAAAPVYRYTHTSAGNTPTIYKRSVRIGILPGNGARAQGLIATSTVTWRTGSLVADQKVELVTYLTNTYDTP